MAVLITSVTAAGGPQIPSGGSTPHKTLDFTGRVIVSGFVDIKDGPQGQALGSAQAIAGTAFDITVNNLDAKKYEFVAVHRDTQDSSEPWVITVT
ncbi:MULTISPECIES: hypothetical protein [Pseudomonas]|uniref:Uncharacterized protein n=1 Tax=Pseudomonas azadiae TaxID=2843612 RepID=A0ABS6NW70_9PSED|nr:MULTISPECIES: hypothetical protein [Pseudomonas]MBV4452465.1 hypothetical protein [Pseudomonas azadiae]NMF41927.1 hypothetical protein [Pseudomonas sp. SWRI 103]